MTVLIDPSETSLPHSTFGLREAIEHSDAAFFLTKPDGRIVDANRYACSLFGYTKEQLIAKGLSGIIDESDPEFRKKIAERHETGRASGELIGICNDGTRFPVEFSSVIFTGKDGETYTSTFITDITERKKTENEIRLLINNTAEAYILTDSNLVILSFNQQFQRLYKRYFGIDVHRGDPILLYSPKERLQNTKTIYMHVLSGETVTSEITVNHPGDGVLQFLLTFAPAKDDVGQVIGVFVTATNITDRKINEKTLLESYQRFRYVTKATRDAIWDFDLQTRNVDLGEGFHHIFGYPVDHTLITEDGWKQRMHPDDRVPIEEAVKQAISSQQETITAEYRYRKANGFYAIVSDRAVIVRDVKGSAVRLVGAAQDITLARNKERQRQLLNEIAHISAQASSLQNMIDHSLHKIVTYGGYLIGEVWLTDSEETFCYLTSDYRGSDQAVVFRDLTRDVRTFRKGDGLVGAIWESGVMQIVPDVDQDPLFTRHAAAKKAGLSSFVGIPLTLHGNMVGVLVLGSADLNTDTGFLKSQFDRLGAFFGMEIHRKQQEDLLRRIAWEQSHLVRAPLARLMGLVDLIQSDQISANELNETLSQIVSSSKELDLIIREIASSTANHPAPLQS